MPRVEPVHDRLWVQMPTGVGAGEQPLAAVGVSRTHVRAGAEDLAGRDLDLLGAHRGDAHEWLGVEQQENGRDR